MSEEIRDALKQLEFSIYGVSDEIRDYAKKDREYALPAQPGIRVVFEDKKRLVVGDTVVGFLVKVFDTKFDDETRTFAQVGAITATEVNGLGNPQNHFGVIYPDGHIECHGVSFETLDSAQNYVTDPKNFFKE